MNKPKTVGASQIPALLGSDPGGRTMTDVWYEMTHDLDPLEGEQLDIGRELEGMLAEWALRRLGEDCDKWKHQNRVYHETLALHSTLDVARHTDEPISPVNQVVAYGGKLIPIYKPSDIRQILELKTTGFIGRAFGNWGPDGTDEVPLDVYHQCHAQMMCADLDTCFVAAWIGGVGRHLYQLERDQDTCDAITDAVKVLFEHIESETPPPDIPPTLETSKRIRRERGKTITLPVTELPTSGVFGELAGWRTGATVHICELYQRLGELSREVDDERSKIKNVLLALLDTAESATMGDWYINAPTRTRENVKVQILRARYPDVAAEVVTTSSFPFVTVKRKTP